MNNTFFPKNKTFSHLSETGLRALRMDGDVPYRWAVLSLDLDCSEEKF